MLRSRSEDLRTKILEEAIGMVAREGVNRTTMRALARRLGISPATLYQHFRNKQHLQREIALHGLVRFQEELAVPLETPDPCEALTGMMARYIQFGLSNPELYQLMFQSLGSVRELGLVNNPRLIEVRGKIHSIYERGMLSGAFRTVDPSVEAAVTWAIMHGFVQLVASSRLPSPHSAVDRLQLQEATIAARLHSLRP